MTNNDSLLCGGGSAAQPPVNRALLLASLLAPLTGEEDDGVLDKLQRKSNNNQNFFHTKSMKDLKFLSSITSFVRPMGEDIALSSEPLPSAPEVTNNGFGNSAVFQPSQRWNVNNGGALFS